MKLPWVSRSESMAWEDCARNAVNDRDALQRKYDALLADHLAYLRPTATVSTSTLNGKTLPGPVAVPVSQPVKRDAVLALAFERAGRDAGLRRHLAAYVLKERQAGTDDETIADKLTHWTDPEDEE
jgi:hypothetical protein